ncbi:hypothetical protein Poli38472_000502 [Pythium oligandrum]|uniref:Protein kinase domain-containing protein n=1 Tax=Pythium oligandrum TaxID=41045 RepID=A0A8K1CC88_PYTOL|nr:hypothetical protein Poli38472_000502 [Pythium oligandrum]|eukprot:TMW60460.1 hypothetical protein Poli38472_000502 [Pythium oligandrum]
MASSQQQVEKALLFAARHGNEAFVRRIISLSSQLLNCRDAYGCTPLIHAAEQGHGGIVHFLIGRGADLQASNIEGSTALHMAASMGCLNTVELLVSAGAKVNAVANRGSTPLSIAVRRGFVAITKFLVDAGADVVAKDDKGYTPVDSAVEMDNAELVKALLKRGRPDPRDSAWDGSVQKALMAAAMRDNKDLVDLLIAFPVIGENGTTSLIRAAVNRLVGLVSRLVAQGENVDARDANGNTALHHVVLHGDAGTASALLEMGADPNSIGQNGWTPLIAACVEGHETLVELLLTRGASINYREPNYGLTALHYAVSRGRGRTHIIERLVRSGASVHPSEACQSTPLLLACSMSKAAAVYAIINTLKLMGEISTVTEIVNAAGPGRWTPVNTSASNGNLELVKFLVANGASLTTKNDKGFSPLHNAVFDGKVDVVEFLLDQKVEIATQNSEGSSPIHTAASRGVVEIAEMLLDAGADFYDNDHDRASLLHAAVFEGHLDMVIMLVKRGADLNARATGGDTPLLLAGDKGHNDILEYLVRCGARIDVVNDLGATPLFAVCMNGNTDACRFLASRLVERGLVAHMDVQIWRGQTALHAAAAAGYLAVVKTLVESGASVNVVDFTEYTPLDTAIFHHHSDIGEYLKEKGAVSNNDEMKVWTTEALTELYSEDLTDLCPRSNARWFIDPTTIQRDVSTRTTRSFVQAEEGRWFGAPVTVFELLPDGSSMRDHSELSHLRGRLRVFFAKEIREWFPLNHPYVLKLYGGCHRNNQLVLVVERVTGGNVREFLDRHPDMKRKWTILLQVALAVQHLHERSVVHGNIRSDMIAVTETGVAKLGGFGVCSRVMQAAEYKDPEWKAMPVAEGMEGDVYALGMCIYEVVTGEPAFAVERRSHRDIKQLVEDGQPPQRHPTFSDRAWNLIKRMCVYHVRHRPHIRDVVLELQEVIREEEACNLPGSGGNTHDGYANVQDQLGDVLSKAKDVKVCASHTPADVVQRLAALWDVLNQSGESTHQRGLKRFCTLLSRLKEDLANYDTNSSTFARLFNDRQLEDAMFSLHNEIDRLARDLDVVDAVANQVHEWRQLWFDRREARLQRLETTLRQEEFANLDDRINELTCLAFELTRHRLSYTTIQPRNLHAACERIKREPGVHIAEWFLPPYEIDFDKFNEFNHGGFGTVHFGTWMNSRVVVKKVSALDPVAFNREVEIWFQLHHPFVIQLFGACHLADQRFFVCEVAENGQLGQYLRRRGVHKGRVMWQRLYEAAVALQFLHYKGVLHCDLKCDNILIGADGKTRLADFGLSSVGENVSDKVTQAVRWTAPEVLLGEAASPASDVYGLAMCIVEAVTGDIPWGRDMDRDQVRTSVRKRRTVDRPDDLHDAQWGLVAEMTRFDVAVRMPLDKTVELMREFAEEEAAREYDENDPEPEQPEPCAAEVNPDPLGLSS